MIFVGGDLDGDFFTVLWDKTLFPKHVVQPMNYRQHRQPVTSDEIHYPSDFINFFIQHMANDALGRIANLWLAHAEKSTERAFAEQCLQLAELHSAAVDYAKTGRSDINFRKRKYLTLICRCSSEVAGTINPQAIPRFYGKTRQGQFHVDIVHR